MLFTREGMINIKNEKWRDDYTGIDPDGYTFVDKQYSKAYLRHLIISKEMLGAQIASIHNLGFYSWLMNECRQQIEDGRFHNFMKISFPCGSFRFRATLRLLRLLLSK